MRTHASTRYGLIAPAMLVIVALTQQVVARGGDLSQWKGGGFGMFSALDSPGTRSLRVFLLGATGPVPLELTSQEPGWLERVRAYPNPGSLRQFGLLLTHRDPLLPFPTRDPPPADSIEMRGVVIEVWKPSFDPALGTLSMRNHRTDTVLVVDGPRWVRLERAVEP